MSDDMCPFCEEYEVVPDWGMCYRCFEERHG